MTEKTINTSTGPEKRPTLHASKPDAKQPSEVELQRAELKRQLAELEAKHGTTPEDPEELRPFLVNLAPSSSYIDYNGTRYYHGQSYMVDYYLYCSLAEIQGNTWKHEATITQPETGRRKNPRFARA